MSDKLPEAIDVLLAAVARRDSQAQHRLVERFGHVILETVRRYLHPRLRRIFDSQDFQQEVWQAFFAGERAPQEFESSDAFARHLAAVTRHRLIDAYRRWVVSARSSLQKSSSLDGSARPAGDELTAATPTSSQVFRAKETWGNLLGGLPEHYRRVAEMRLDGYSNIEIAERLDINEKTVRRVLERLDATLAATAR